MKIGRTINDEDSPMLQKTNAEAYDREYQQLWQKFKTLSDTDDQFEDIFERVCAIEKERRFTQAELRKLRGKI